MTLSRATYDPLNRLGARDGNFSGGVTVTQLTNRTTGVTANGLSGSITTNNASLAAEASAVFVVTNNAVFTDDIVMISIQGGTNGGNTDVTVVVTTNGTFSINVSNNNPAAGTAETGAIVINFLIMKASTT